MSSEILLAFRESSLEVVQTLREFPELLCRIERLGSGLLNGLSKRLRRNCLGQLIDVHSQLSKLTRNLVEQSKVRFRLNGSDAAVQLKRG
jgi:hypothetical protein